MKDRRLSRELTAMLPWFAAALVWFGLVAPLRADRESRLLDQGRVRRERVKIERALRSSEATRARLAATLSSACRASADPAALRQRMVMSASDLALSPLSLAVTGGPGGGATVEAEGARDALFSLLERLGDPARGGFLRTASLRSRDSRWVASVSTGVIDSFPEGLLKVRSDCDVSKDPVASEGPPESPKATPSPAPVRRAPRSIAPPVPVTAPSIASPVLPPPFTLVGFLVADGKSRVSVRLGDEVRVISVGDSVAGFRCASIDRDLGAVFIAPDGTSLVLRSGLAPSPHVDQGAPRV